MPVRGLVELCAETGGTLEAPLPKTRTGQGAPLPFLQNRSEERRVGKECVP